MDVNEERKPFLALFVGEDAHQTGDAGQIDGAPAGVHGREWDGEVMQVCGDCDARGVSVFCLVFWCFPIAFGVNMKRALNLSNWKIAVFAIGYCAIVYLTVWWAFASVICMKELHPEVKVELNEPGWCVYLSPQTMMVLQIVKSLAPVWVWLLGAYIRTVMRNRFNLPGSKWPDHLLWACCGACAQCQQLRTLLKNNVRSGVWHGPTTPISPPVASATAAPSVQSFMTPEALPVKV